MARDYTTLVHCLRCGYRWQAQSTRPRRCPRCNCRTWDRLKWLWEHHMTALFLSIPAVHSMLWAGDPTKQQESWYEGLGGRLNG